MDKDTLQGALAEYFAPWVQALGLQVESFGPGEVTLRLENWPEAGGVEPVEDPEGVARLAAELDRAYNAFLDEERAPATEDAARGEGR